MVLYSVVYAVEAEIQQTRHHHLRIFRKEKILQIIIAQRREFNIDLSHDTHLNLLFIRKLQWLLTAEMLELAHGGVRNIVCTQPFGCLPNHIVGKGMIRRIKEKNPGVNIITMVAYRRL